MLDNLWAINVNITEHNITRQVPSFILNGNTHGITSVAHAHKIARDIVNLLGITNLEINVTAVRM